MSYTGKSSCPFCALRKESKIGECTYPTRKFSHYFECSVCQLKPLENFGQRTKPCERCKKPIEYGSFSNQCRYCCMYQNHAASKIQAMYRGHFKQTKAVEAFFEDLETQMDELSFEIHASVQNDDSQHLSQCLRVGCDYIFDSSKVDCRKKIMWKSRGYCEKCFWQSNKIRPLIQNQPPVTCNLSKNGWDMVISPLLRD
jgi:hypothetical protein